MHRYNAKGLAGLVNRRGVSRPCGLDPGQVAEPVSWLEAGPDPAVDGAVRWRRQDLRARMAERFGVELHERTVGKCLAALGYRRLSARPRHPKTDPGAQELFSLKTFDEAVAAALPETARDKLLEPLRGLAGALAVLGK